jgi:hypothetical protein
VRCGDADTKASHKEQQIMANPPDPRSDAALDALLSASIDVFGLTVQATWRDEARQVVKVIADAARLIQAAALDDRAEPAVVFRT